MLLEYISHLTNKLCIDINKHMLFRISNVLRHSNIPRNHQKFTQKIMPKSIVRSSIPSLSPNPSASSFFSPKTLTYMSLSSTIIQYPGMQLSSMYFASKPKKHIKDAEVEAIIHSNDGIWHEPRRVGNRGMFIKTN